MSTRLWRWPNEVLGRLAATLAPGARPRRVGDTIFLVDDRFDRLFRIVPRHPTAMTFGSTVIARTVLDDALIAHELTHVQQYGRLGPLYLPLYLLGALWGLLRHRDSYTGNPFEAAALAAARGQRGSPATRAPRR